MKFLFVIFVIFLGAPLAIAQSDLLLGPVAMTWDNAVNYCNERHRNLLRIENSEKNDLVKNYATDKGLADYWIDDNDKLEEGKFVDSDNKSIVFEYWRTGMPNGGRSQNCLYAKVGYDYRWDDWACDSGESAVICDKEYEFKVPKEFIVVGYKPLYKAEAFCNTRTRTIVRIENSAKNDRVIKYVKFTFPEEIQNYWINANDNAEENKFVYSDNTPIEFKFWSAGQPNGSRDENCVYADANDNYRWSDCDCTLKNIHVLCDRRNCSNRNYSSIETKMTYYDAVNYCDTNGMDLVTIADAAINEKVFEYAKSKNLDSYWINGNDIANETIWVDAFGSKLRFLNWDSSQPDGAYVENCIAAGQLPTEKWYDAPCQSKYSVICETCDEGN